MNIELLWSWLSIDSTTGRERAYLEALEAHFVGQGLRVERQAVADERWNLVVDSGVAPEVWLCTHVDTVPPHFGPRRDGDLLRARGACDTKGGLFAMWCAWRELPDAMRARVGFVLVVGEEVDHIGALVAGRSMDAGARAIVLCEPTRNLMARGQKGILKIRLSTTGRAGHSAFAEAGHSAVDPLIDALHALQHEDWPTDDELGPTTLNIGLVSGGVAANVFAPEASAELLFRATCDPDVLEARVRALVPDVVQVTRIAANPPVRLTTWPRFDTDVVPFNTDAPYLAHLASVVLVGPGDIRTAHCPDEQISLADLEAGVALYGELLRGLLTGELAVPN